jgi:hypothetical protein
MHEVFPRITLRFNDNKRTLRCLFPRLAAAAFSIMSLRLFRYTASTAYFYPVQRKDHGIFLKDIRQDYYGSSWPDVFTFLQDSFVLNLFTAIRFSWMVRFGKIGMIYQGMVLSELTNVSLIQTQQQECNKCILLTLWTRRAAFAASKFPCLTIDGNADSRGTSAIFQTVTLFYAVCTIFPSKSFVFDQIKSFFLLQGMVFGRHFVTFIIFSLPRGIYAQKRCFWWVNLYVLPSV